ncbi:MAG: phosphate ABC transporter permease subunit PstC [Alphaproteobacteria bacterium]|nr:phosphate ABC transporter permease subunit PstC [Alphaproteobacteria bacterium]
MFVIIILIFFIFVITFYLGYWRAKNIVQGNIKNLKSLPHYHGWYVGLICFLASLIFFFIWWTSQTHINEFILHWFLPHDLRSLESESFKLALNQIYNVLENKLTSPDTTTSSILEAANHLKIIQNTTSFVFYICFTIIVLSAFILSFGKIKPNFSAGKKAERIILFIFFISSTLAITTTVGIILSLLFEALRFFQRVPLNEFIFGLHWSPQIALRADQTASSGSFGMIPLLTGSILITVIAMIIAVPVGLMSAIYLSEYAPRSIRTIVKPVLEILAGIPTIVYGFFAALTVAPFLKDIGDTLNISVASESALAAGLVMGIMIIPFISSLSDDIINAVPQSLRDGSYALGATQSETIRHVILSAALPGIISAILLGVSRAIGETMIVVMAAGLSANLTFNPFNSVTTMTVQIANLLVGDQEFDNPKTLAAFALGLILFIMTFILNIIALYIVKKYREKYE